VGFIPGCHVDAHDTGSLNLGRSALHDNALLHYKIHVDLAFAFAFAFLLVAGFQNEVELSFFLLEQ